MKYIIDNDLHIHSMLSLCAHDDKEQSPERILEYAQENNLKTICITDHFWDETVDGIHNEDYTIQNYSHICAAKPLPQAENVKFLFGCETELDKNLVLGVSKERMDLFDFIVIPTTHFHMKDYTLTDEDAKDVKSRANAWIKRLDAILEMDLPFYKVGIAHLTCKLIAPTREGYTREDYLEILRLLPDEEMHRLFTKAAKLRVGIELNSYDMNFADDEADVVLRPYRIAKQCGCKFYLGSDAHHPKNLYCARQRFERAIDMLELTEEDKFIIQGI